MAKFIIKKTSDDEHRFTLRASNNKVILTSETYNSLKAAMDSIEAVKRYCGEDSFYEKGRTRDEKYYFNLKSINGEVIGTSQRYRSRSGMYSGIRAVKKAARQAEIVDLTKIKSKTQSDTVKERS